MSQKRKDYISWDEYFMSLVALSSIKSNYDINGACIVDTDKRILSLGYKDIPIGIKKNYNETSEYFAISPLSNAIYNFRGKRQEFEAATLYLSSFPNYEEAKQIAQARIKNVVFLNNELDEDIENISRKILGYANIIIEPYFNSKYSLDEYKIFLQDLREAIKSNIGKTSISTLNNDEYFMGIAVLASLRSKDPSTQVGACLVDQNNRVLSIGYNGAPTGMNDDILPWASLGEKIGNLLTTKNPYIVHAEMNVFDNYKGFTSDLKDTKLYLLYSPCKLCTERISSLEVGEIIYLREYTKNNTLKISSEWLIRSKTNHKLYKTNSSYTKEDCLKLIDETTKVIKKNLARKSL